MDKILFALLDTEKMTYQQVVDITDPPIRRKDARKRLNELIRKKFIREEGRENWKHGKKLYYSITEKGRRECFREATENISLFLRTLEKITSQLNSDPEKLDEWRDNINRKLHAVATDNNIPLSERIQYVMEKRDSYFGSFRRALKEMHELSLSLFMRKDDKASLLIKKDPSANLTSSVFLLVAENGVIDVVTEFDVMRSRIEVKSI